jgi:hypothetical protein
MMCGRACVVVSADGMFEAGCGVGRKNHIAHNQRENQGRGGEPVLSSIVHQRGLNCPDCNTAPDSRQGAACAYRVWSPTGWARDTHSTARGAQS